jgi:hypothetical protein
VSSGWNYELEADDAAASGVSSRAANRMENIGDSAILFSGYKKLVRDSFIRNIQELHHGEMVFAIRT